MIVGCSDTPAGSDDPSETQSISPSPSESDEPETVNGVELTPQGSQLAVGDEATVAYGPRQGQVAVLDIKVTRLEKTSFKESFDGWDLSAETKKKAPYFVRATVTNRGTADLGGRPVPLYIVDGNNVLIEATSFASTFKPCSPGTFPEKFSPGKKADVCLVYLVPNKGELTAVSFRPAEDFDPIVWTGELKEPKKPKDDKPGKGDKGDGGGQ